MTKKYNIIHIDNYMYGVDSKSVNNINNSDYYILNSTIFKADMVIDGIIWNKSPLYAKHKTYQGKKIIFSNNPALTSLPLLPPIEEDIVNIAAEKAISEDIKVPDCDDHTPYWGPCVSCGSYDNPDVIVGSRVNKNSILQVKTMINYD